MNSQKYILHTTPEDNSEGIKSEGFFYVKGWPTVTGNIPVVVDHAIRQGYIEKPETIGKLWNIFLMELPKEKRLKTSVKGNITTNHNKKEIHGKANIRMGGKSQGAIYQGGEHHQGKKNILNEKLLDKDILPKENILLELQPTPELISIANKLRTIIPYFKQINIKELKNELGNAIKISTIYQKQGIEVEAIIDDILMSTLQSSCIEFIRSLYLASAHKHGYKTYINKKGDLEKERDIKELKNHHYKMIDSFLEYVKTSNEKDFDLFKDSKYEILNRYIKSSIKYINKKFWIK